MPNDLPQPYQDFTSQHPGVAKAYEQLGEAVHEAGPLDDRVRRLVKLALAVGGRLEGAVRSHARQARSMGISDAELDHVVLLALPTIGLPSTVAARSWLQESE